MAIKKTVATGTKPMVARRTYIVEEGPNPSTDYFVMPALKHEPNPVIRCTWDQLPSAQDLEFSSVIFVRYVPTHWKQRIAQVRATLVRLIYFMDDDLLDIQASSGLSWKYRYKLAMHATRHQRWLEQMQASLWVSTPWLKSKYADRNPALVEPEPVAPASRTCRVFYHGSASHREEIEWLRPVIEQCIDANPSISFEIIGDQAVNQLYRSIPRVTIVHPMKWPSYQTFLAIPGRDIGLAPMLDHPFNQSRSYTKFFDITRAGAVGVYAKPGPWQHLIDHEKNGLLCPMESQAWVDAILALAANAPEVRQALVQNAQEKITFLSNPRVL
jgi:hypothetical protein